MQADVFRARSGVSARQLHTWTVAGHLRASPRPAGAGSGVPREWPAEEAEVAQRIRLLLEAGFTLKKAAELARLKNGEQQLGRHVRVTLAF